MKNLYKIQKDGFPHSVKVKSKSFKTVLEKFFGKSEKIMARTTYKGGDGHKNMISKNGVVLGYIFEYNPEKLEKEKSIPEEYFISEDYKKSFDY